MQFSHIALREQQRRRQQAVSHRHKTHLNTMNLMIEMIAI